MKKHLGYLAAACLTALTASGAYLEGEADFLALLDSQQSLLNAEKAAQQALYGFLADLLSVEQSINYFPFMEADADSRVRELEARLRE